MYKSKASAAVFRWAEDSIYYSRGRWWRSAATHQITRAKSALTFLIPTRKELGIKDLDKGQFVSLAVQNSSIGDFVTQSLTKSGYFYFLTLKSHPRDL